MVRSVANHKGILFLPTPCLPLSCCTEGMKHQNTHQAKRQAFLKTYNILYMIPPPCLAWPSFLNCTGQLTHPSSSWHLWIIVCWTKGKMYSVCVCVRACSNEQTPSKWTSQGLRRGEITLEQLWVYLGVISPFRDQRRVCTTNTRCPCKVCNSGYLGDNYMYA